MSQTMQGIDAKGYLIGWLNGLNAMYMADINAMNEADFTKSPGGVARPVNEVTADAINLLNWTTEALKGNIIPMDEAYPADFAASLTTKAAIGEALGSAVAGFSAALASASDESLNAVVMPPWQMEAPLFMLAMIAVSHVWYHDGQLNYIQALGGDGEVHWMG